MKTTNPHTLSFVAMRIAPLCLALTWLSGPAAASVTSGTADGKVTCDANDNCTSNTPLTVGPGPGAGGGPINPADFGMCGVLHLSGAFGSTTVARIIVNSDGYFAVERKGKGVGGVPQVDWTCVLFTDFTGLPKDYLAKLDTYAAPPAAAKRGGTASNTIGHGGDACVWAGLSGTLAGEDGASATVYAQDDDYAKPPYTLQFAQAGPKTSVETYAWCTGVPPKGYDWNIQNNVEVPGLGTTTAPLPVSLIPPGRDHWCFVDGVGTSPGGTFTSAGLTFLGLDSYTFEVGKESKLWFNCLILQQDHGPANW